MNKIPTEVLNVLPRTIKSKLINIDQLINHIMIYYYMIKYQAL